jgi:hypothetical protein
MPSLLPTLFYSTLLPSFSMSPLQFSSQHPLELALLRRTVFPKRQG